MKTANIENCFIVDGITYLGTIENARKLFEADIEGTEEADIDDNFSIFCSNNLTQIDKEITKVKFLIEKGSECEVFAYFPEMEYYPKDASYYGFDPKMRSSYAHIGQHSACHPSYARLCKVATKEQYQELKEELESIGYKLKILNRK